MNKHTMIANICLVIAFICTSISGILIGTNNYHFFLTGIWIVSMISTVVSAFIVSRLHIPTIYWTHKTILIGLLVLLPAIVRVVNYQPYRIHGDDLLTATFSKEFHPLTTNFFAGIPEGTQWVAKFPAPYFFLQKIFLRIFGATVLTVKLSVLPYILIVSFITYTIASMLLGPVAGATSVVIYAFMAISIYHETLGLHFVSSTALYMVFFYTLIHSLKSNKPFWFALSGITAASCYLSYTSSYIAFPMLILAIIIRRIYAGNTSVSRWIIWSFIGFFVTIAPFLTYALTQENYFGGRINQVSLLTGSWSATKLTSPSIPVAFDILSHNTNIALLSMVEDGIGGHGGYTFNQRAFFHPFGLLLFLLGTCSLLLWKKHTQEGMLIIGTIVLSFITGVVLTIPPPAYHRLTLTFPFIAIISAIPFALLSQHKFTKYGMWITCTCLAIYAGVNLHYFQTSVHKEALIEDAAIVQLINTKYPRRHIHIAAFPSFALEKILPFFTPYTALSIDTKYHLNYLQNFNTKESYLYVITLPNEFIDQFKAADPKGIIIPFSEKYTLMINEEQ